MEYSTNQDHLDSCMMSAHRLADASPELKKRVLHAAHNAWTVTETAPAEVSWISPMLRLAASLAISVGLVYSANVATRHTTTRWQAFEDAPVTARPYSAFQHSARLSSLAAVAVSFQPREVVPLLVFHEQRVKEVLGLF